MKLATIRPGNYQPLPGDTPGMIRERVMQAARSRFPGRPELAELWFKASSPLLGGRRPVDIDPQGAAACIAALTPPKGKRVVPSLL